MRQRAKEQFLSDRAHFDRVDCIGCVERVQGDEVVVRIESKHPIHDQWDFVARWNGTDYHCQVERREGALVFGLVRERAPIPDWAEASTGVVLLRPTYLRPTIPSATPPSEKELWALQSEVSAMWMAALPGDISFNPPSDFLHGDGLRGRVLDITSAQDRTEVRISLGRKDGIRVGDEFRIARGSGFVGFVHIVELKPDSSIGVFDSQFPGKAAPPRVADAAYTH
ncbi:MAG: hypothetical protein ACYTGZ_00850 [Planctomycetota bacterium]